METTKELDFKDLITYKEAGKALRVSTETIRTWVRQGKIKKYPLTYRTVFLNKKELKEFILSKEE